MVIALPRWHDEHVVWAPFEHVAVDFGAALALDPNFTKARESLAALQAAHPDVPIHMAAVDRHLNEHCYIVPGLGDAGDRQFGTE